MARRSLVGKFRSDLISLLGRRGYLTYHFARHVLNNRRNVLRNLHRYWYQMSSHDHDKVCVTERPYHLRLYEEVVKQYVQNETCVFLSAYDATNREKRDPDRVNLVLRHDLDSLPERVKWFCDIEMKYGLRSAIYVIVGPQHFEGSANYAVLGDLQQLLLNLNREGFEIGLHSIAWAQGDFVEAFAAEVEIFRQIFEFLPRTYTLHGFLSETETGIRRWPFLKWDSSGHFKSSYPYLAGRRLNGRIMLSDSWHYGRPISWPSQPPSLKRVFLGEIGVILTHSESWVCI